MTTYRYLQPLDVLFLRGNKLFGAPGSFGESLIPPWPSIAAGALRSLMLAEDGASFEEFAAGRERHPSLGTPTEPGPFKVTAFDIARRAANGELELLVEPPADLVLSRADDGGLGVSCLAPTALSAWLSASAPLPLLPILAQSSRRKPAGGFWLNQRAFADYLQGRTPSAADLVASADLWQLDPRIGIGLDAERRRADDGKLFTAQAVVLRPDVGFLVGIQGAEPPTDGLLRLGGDGRGASMRQVAFEPPEPDLAAIVGARRCRIVLTSPGIFADGWRLPGVGADGRLELNGLRGRLASAAVPRAETVSGWNLATRQPKPAQRAAPRGSVYWIDQLEATPEALRKLAANGLWTQPCDHPQRRAEGFNRFTFATWS